MQMLLPLLDSAGRLLVEHAGAMLVQSGVLILLVFLLDRLLRGRVRAGFRHALWLLVLVKLVLPPSLGLPTGIAWWGQGLLPTAVAEAGPAQPAVLLGSDAPALSNTLERISETGSPETVPVESVLSGTGLGWPGALLLLWLTGVGAFSVHFFCRRRAHRWRFERARPVACELEAEIALLARQVGLRRPPTTRLGECLETPSVSGLFRPKLLLPAGLVERLDEDRLGALLLHELVHIKRRDLWVSAAQSVLQVLYFFHPLFWFASAALGRAREEAVDEHVLALPGKESAVYPETLLAVARWLAGRPSCSPALVGVAERRSHLRWRIQRLLSRPIPSSVNMGLGGRGAVLVAGLLLLPMAPPPEGLGAAFTAAEAGTPGQEASQGEPARIVLAVGLGLDWLARHQDPTGNWDGDGFMGRCAGEKCTGKGSPVHDVGLTGLALYALLQDRSGLYAGPVKAAAKWLLGQQDKQGLIGERAGQAFMYSHLIATLALTEMYSRSRAEEMLPRLQKALGYIAAARNPYKVWRYYPRDGDNDSSMTSWAVWALATGRDQGLRVDAESIKYALAWFDEMTDPATFRVGYTIKGSPPARPKDLAARFPASRSEAITAAALHARILAGQRPETVPVLNGHASLLRATPPLWSEGSIDLYYWLFGTLALKRMGGPAWQEWRSAMLAVLLSNQRQEGCAKGSWDPAGVWGHEGGRVYATALMVIVGTHLLLKE